MQFPKQLLVRIACEGSDEEYLAVGTAPDELSDEIVEGGSIYTARYVLVGTGTIQHSAPQYVEDAPHTRI